MSTMTTAQGTRQRDGIRRSAVHRYRGVLLAGTALTAVAAISLLGADPAAAACTNTGTFPNITAFNCTNDDTSGHSIGTFIVVPISGNNTNITGTIATGATISNSSGSVPLSIVMGNGADLTITGTDPFNQINAVNAHAFRFGATSSGSIFTFDYAGQITSVNGNAVNGTLLQGGDVNITFADTALVTASGTSDLLGAPTSGAGVAITSVTGSGNITVTNHGEFRTQNDAVFIAKTAGAGTMTVNNDGVIGTEALPIGGMGVNIFGTNANANGVVNNNGGSMWTSQNTVNLIVGGTGTVTNVDGELHSVNGTAVFIASGGTGSVDNTDGTIVGQTGGVSINSLTGDAILNNTNGSVTTTNGTAASLLGLGAGTVTNIGGTITSTNGQAVLVATSGNGSVDNTNGTVTGSTGGISVNSLTGTGSVDNTGGSVTTTDGTGINVLAATGAVTIQGDAASSVTSTNGGGIFGLGTSAAVDAGVVTSGDNGVIGIGTAGDATVNLHGNVTVTGGGTVGALAVSVGGNASVTSDAGITVDPPIGMASVVVGSGVATTTNNGTVVSTLIGLAGVNIGDGAVQIDNTGTVDATASGAGIVAVKIGANNNPVSGNASVLINNTGTVDAPNGAGVAVVAFDPTFTTPNDVLINNDFGGTSITGAGGFLTPAVGVLADGAVTVNNTRGALITNAAGLGGSAANILAGGNVEINNNRGADIEGTMVIASLTGSATVNNDRGATWSSSGLNVIGAAVDATINNDRGGEIAVVGSGALALVAGNNATINNTRNSDITLAGINAAVMVAGNDATINNDRGSDITLAGINAAVIAAGNNAAINNSRGSDITLAGLNAALIVAGNDATIDNSRGADINLVGANAAILVAGNNATINNSRGADITLAGLNAAVLVAGTDATIDNSRGATLNLLGINGDFLVAGGNATLNNSTGGHINLVGINSVAMAAGGTATVNNSANDGGDNNADCTTVSGICVTGIATFTGTGASPLTFNNAGGLVSMINGYSGFGTGPISPSYGTYVGDVTVINGNFVASGTSQLGVDARLGGPGADSASDLLLITNAGADGSVTGSTGIVVNSGGEPGQYNTTGIPVVAVTSGLTAAHDFFIDPTSTNYQTIGGTGVIDKGLFFYALTQKPNATIAGGVDHVLVGLPDVEAFQLTYLASGAQSIWYETALGWLDRQGDLRNYHLGGPAAAAPGGPGYGVWVKASGSWTDRSASQRVPGYNQFRFNTGYDQDTYSVIAGVDGAKDGAFSAGDTLVGSIMGGFVTSDLDFKRTGSNFKYDGGVIGATASYMNNGWFVDGLVKADILDVDVNLPGLGAFGKHTRTTGVTSFGGMGNVGYRFDWGSAFIEPIATLAYVRTWVDDFKLQTIGVNFRDAESFRGALGARVGTRFAQGSGYVADASLIARVWDEWEGKNTVGLGSTGPGLTLSDGGMKGVFGEVSGHLNVASGTTGWSGFIDGGVKFNDDFTTLSAKVGARYQW